MNKYFLLFQFTVITISLILSLLMGFYMISYPNFNKTFFNECQEISLCMVGMIISSVLLFLSQSGKICCHLMNDKASTNCGCYDCIGIIIVLLINIWGWYIYLYNQDCTQTYVNNFRDLFNVFFGQLILFFISIIVMVVIFIYQVFCKKEKKEVSLSLENNNNI